MCIASWKSKATGTCLEYVILSAFPLQQWLRGLISLLLYMYIYCLVLKSVVFRAEYDFGTDQSNSNWEYQILLMIFAVQQCCAFYFWMPCWWSWLLFSPTVWTLFIVVVIKSPLTETCSFCYTHCFWNVMFLIWNLDQWRAACSLPDCICLLSHYACPKKMYSNFWVNFLTLYL